MFKSIVSKRRLLALTAVLGAVVTLTACGGDGDDADPVPKPNPVTTAPTTTCSAAGIAASNASTAAHTVCMLTSDGEIVIELDARAPLSVDNFLKYVNAKFYDNTIFHRVPSNFVVQGGGFTTGDVLKTGLNAPIKLESNIAGLSNTKGTIGMARTSVADSATSQFYFNTVNNAAILDYVNANQPGYAVFGRVILGQTTIDKINSEARLSTNPERPATEVLLYWAIQLK